MESQCLTTGTRPAGSAEPNKGSGAATSVHYFFRPRSFSMDGSPTAKTAAKRNKRNHSEGAVAFVAFKLGRPGRAIGYLSASRAAPNSLLDRDRALKARNLTGNVGLGGSLGVVHRLLGVLGVDQRKLCVVGLVAKPHRDAELVGATDGGDSF